MTFVAPCAVPVAQRFAAQKSNGRIILIPFHLLLENCLTGCNCHITVIFLKGDGHARHGFDNYQPDVCRPCFGAGV
jgi:hypothetical protein